MWEQMIGEANISWYDLGNKVLFMMVDSKSNISLFYHLPFINNKERGKADSVMAVHIKSICGRNQKAALKKIMIYIGNISK